MAASGPCGSQQGPLASLLSGFGCCQGRYDKFDDPLIREEQSATVEPASAPEAAASVQPVCQTLSGPLAETVRLAEALLPSGRLSQWQRDWCTAEQVARFLRGRDGDPAAAAVILAQALRWREEYQAVLSGAREPRWQTDLRVLTCGERGHPVIYGCFRHNVRATAETTPHIIDHMVAVMEAAAVEARRRGVQEADTIMDCHGYRMADNLNPAPMLALMRMANQPYRDGLRAALVVDAPYAFQFLWKAAAPLLSEKTKRKIHFLSRAEAVRMLTKSSGPKAAAEVDHVMGLNRSTEGCQANQFPSELPQEQADAGQQSLRRAITRRITRALTHLRLADDRDSTSRWSLRALCCRRRRAPAPATSEQAGADTGRSSDPAHGCVAQAEVPAAAVGGNDGETTTALSERQLETIRLAAARLPGGRMTKWQRDWCTALNVDRYLRGRGGDPAAAAAILAEALQWREEHQEVLSGARQPVWQTDLRLLTCGKSGNPILYGCFRHNVRPTAKTLPHIVDHMAAVMEAALVEGQKRGAPEADNIMDCHGYRMADNLNPAPMLALMRMANQPYRDCLRTAYVVDAPAAFHFLWKAAVPLLPEKTRRKVRFVSREEAIKLIAEANGSQAAEDVDRVMRLNRTPEGCQAPKFPSEVRQEAEADEEEEAAQPWLNRARTLTRALTRVLPAVPDVKTGLSWLDWLQHTALLW